MCCTYKANMLLITKLPTNCQIPDEQTRVMILNVKCTLLLLRSTQPEHKHIFNQKKLIIWWELLHFRPDCAEGTVIVIKVSWPNFSLPSKGLEFITLKLLWGRGRYLALCLQPRSDGLTAEKYLGRWWHDEGLVSRAVCFGNGSSEKWSKLAGLFSPVRSSLTGLENTSERNSAPHGTLGPDIEPWQGPALCLCLSCEISAHTTSAPAEQWDKKYRAKWTAVAQPAVSLSPPPTPPRSLYLFLFLACPPEQSA